MYLLQNKKEATQNWVASFLKTYVLNQPYNDLSRKISKNDATN